MRRKLKNIYILVAIVAVLTLVIVLYTLSERTREKKVTYIPGIESIRIERGTDTVEIALTERPPMLTKPLPYLADSVLISRLIADIEALKIGEIISEREEKFKDFGVDEGGVKVKLISPQKEISFFIGKYAGDYEHSYLRFEGDDKVYLSKGLSKYSIDRDPNQWRDKTIFSFDKDGVIEITIGDKHIEKRDTIWVCGDSEVDKNSANSVLSLFSGFRADGFADILDFSPKVHISFILKGEVYNFELGDKINNQYPVRTQGKSTIFLVGEGRIEKLLKLIK